MAITLVRVDDRVIHGQTTTRWSKERKVDGIIVIGDTIAKNDLRKKVLKAAAGSLKIGIYGMDMAAEKIEKAKRITKNFFIISDSPQNFAKLMEKGGDFGDVLNVGCMNTRQGSVVIGRTVAIDEEDYKAFEYMESQNINIEFQLVPGEEIYKWEDMKKKYEQKMKKNGR